MSAETMGKVPALCAPDGQFLTNYTGCVACGEEQIHGGTSDSGSGWGGFSPWGPPSTGAAAVNTTSPAYPNPVFGQYLGYCNVSDVHVVYTVTATSASTESGAATSSIAPTVVTTDIVLAHDFTTASSQAGSAATVTAAPGPSPTSSTPAPGAAGSGGRQGMDRRPHRGRGIRYRARCPLHRLRHVLPVEEEASDDGQRRRAEYPGYGTRVSHTRTSAVVAAEARDAGPATGEGTAACGQHGAEGDTARA
ncbi:hypothetical protein PG996_005835 [Apiospora saccharicola]|uniref:Uncharacterized protein n=1 Tax=Apiospora saccharicola TaxID=335842 RepID=A0ABR1VNP6_9PEZI